MTLKEELILAVVDKAAIGLLILIAGYFLNSWLEEFRTEQSTLLETFKRDEDRKAEQDRWEQKRTDELATSIRVGIVELARKLAAGNHAISWLTFNAKHEPREVAPEQIRAYESEIKVVLSEIVAARVNLAALSKDMHDRVAHLVDEFYGRDGAVGRQLKLLPTEPDDAIRALAEIHDETHRYDKKLTQEFLGLVASMGTALAGMPPGLKTGKP
jgi:hypothetical protein